MCVTVPGAAALWDDLAKTYGSLPLSQILSYAIKLADEGFPISPITSATWAGYLNAEGERVLRPHGRVPHAGEIIHNPDLAQTLRSIAEHGAAKGYYQGRVAEAVVAAAQAHGGVLDLQDLANHKTKFVQPISVAYKGLRIYETPPPSQGLAALIALRLIEKVEELSGSTSAMRSQEPLRFDANYAKRSSVDDTHLVLECMRVACAEALHHITDPLVQSVPVEELLSDAFITAAAQKISTTTSTTVRATDYEAFQRGETAYFCAVDRHGNACSMISSNFQGFGTGIMPINCGFTLQNRGMNFSLQPGHPNQVMPNKRPYHTIIPAMVTYDSDNTLFGVMGCMVSALLTGQTVSVRFLWPFRSFSSISDDHMLPHVLPAALTSSYSCVWTGRVPPADAARADGAQPAGLQPGPAAGPGRAPLVPARNRRDAVRGGHATQQRAARGRLRRALGREPTED
jgi:gamma-glutamyltranspeptidase/glutathione hydrolase